jgi:hypothetical protein
LVVRYSAGQNSPVPLCCADGRGQLIGLAEFAALCSSRHQSRVDYVVASVSIAAFG